MTINIIKNIFLPAVFSLAVPGSIQAQTPAVFNVGADKPAADVQPTMWGIFFEDINLGADGGLYAELVKNRSFEFAAPLMGWREQKPEGASGSLLIQNRGEKNAANPRYLRASIKNGKYGFSNEGFRGMGIRQGETYDFSVWARQAGEQAVKLILELQNAKGEVIGKASLTPASTAWKKEKVSFTATRATSTDLEVRRTLNEK